MLVIVSESQAAQENFWKNEYLRTDAKIRSTDNLLNQFSDQAALARRKPNQTNLTQVKKNYFWKHVK